MKESCPSGGFIATGTIPNVLIFSYLANFSVRFCQLVVTYGSTYVLVALSVDRYDAITHPMRFNRSCE